MAASSETTKRVILLIRYPPAKTLPMADYANIKLERDGAVARLMLNRPERRNALTHAMMLELEDAFAGLRQDNRCRALVIRGAGGHFCAGVGRVVVHNSERRGLEFVTRKVTQAAARIKLGNYYLAGSRNRADIVAEAERLAKEVLDKDPKQRLRGLAGIDLAFEHVELLSDPYVFMLSAELDLQKLVQTVTDAATKLSRAVKATLGPRGRNVVLQAAQGLEIGRRQQIGSR